jgi:hypothetical protein
MGWLMGLEPTTTGITILVSQLINQSLMLDLWKMASAKKLRHARRRLAIFYKNLFDP